MKIKVCGLKYSDNILEVSKLDVDMLGFIFYKKSPRFVENSLTLEILEKIPKNIEKIGVFVNSSTEEIKDIVLKYKLTGVQLHGNETPEECKLLKDGLLVIKSFLIKDDFDFSVLEAYQYCCDYFLFDTYTKDYGGSGKKFDWNLLNSYKLSTPFFLSGGISIDDVELICNFSHPKFFGIDINSKFEISPGLKDVEKISNFINLIKNN